MAIYRFRVSFEDYDDVSRDIDIRSTQTFEDLHIAIHKTTAYPVDRSSSFFVSNDQWIKGEEIAHNPSQRKIDNGVILMEGTRLSRFIDDPHQKFYYIYNFERPFDFHVELIKILDEQNGVEYPSVARSIGEAPKMIGLAGMPAPEVSSDDEDDDVLNDDTEYGFEEGDTDEMGTVDETGEAEDTNEDEGDDDFMDEFSDNDNYESDEYNNNKDDY